MSETAITVENLSKSYLVGHQTSRTDRNNTLRDVIAHNARSLANKTRDMFAGRAIVQGDEIEEFWALKNVSVEIRRGDRVGIIGRNGAGKSTLLKILSRITEPTRGRVVMHGKVASLLEVGTGFHPELTGRENIYLNGAILGMSRPEIQSKFDEIVQFAEVERFLDTPVKRYSSGMYVRLAFAVAAFLEQDVLIIDEILAVGDVEFQRKCIAKMKDVSAQEGKSILLVTHNLSQLHALCSKGILLERGALTFEGSTTEAVSRYVGGAGKASEINLRDYARSGHSVEGLRLTNIAFGGASQPLQEGGVFTVFLSYEATQGLEELVFGVALSDEFQTLIECRSGEAYPQLSVKAHSQGTIRVQLKLRLRAGIYSLNVGARSLRGLHEYIPAITPVEILAPEALSVESWKRSTAGTMLTDAEWVLDGLNK